MTRVPDEECCKVIVVQGPQGPADSSSIVGSAGPIFTSSNLLFGQGDHSNDFNLVDFPVGHDCHAVQLYDAIQSPTPVEEDARYDIFLARRTFTPPNTYGNNSVDAFVTVTIPAGKDIGIACASISLDLQAEDVIAFGLNNPFASATPVRPKAFLSCQWSLLKEDPETHIDLMIS